jgi:hypothetical protein
MEVWSGTLKRWFLLDMAWPSQVKHVLQLQSYEHNERRKIKRHHCVGQR